MPVRVRMRARSLKGLKINKALEISALLNTGYTGSSPEIMVPVRLAEEMGFWPPPVDAIESTYETAGGPARFHAIRDAVTLKVIDDDAESRELTADVIISPMEREALLSDVVIGELEIIILNAHKGYWRFSFDPSNKIRYTKRVELW
jgi:hypothetical protein